MKWFLKKRIKLMLLQGLLFSTPFKIHQIIVKFMMLLRQVIKNYIFMTLPKSENTIFSVY
jgi:hypothetical protein